MFLLAGVSCSLISLEIEVSIQIKIKWLDRKQRERLTGLRTRTEHFIFRNMRSKWGTVARHSLLFSPLIAASVGIKIVFRAHSLPWHFTVFWGRNGRTNGSHNKHKSRNICRGYRVQGLKIARHNHNAKLNHWVLSSKDLPLNWKCLQSSR